MIYSVFQYNLQLIWVCNLAINEASSILRLPTISHIAFFNGKCTIIIFASN